jgi:hypothetical protein
LSVTKGLWKLSSPDSSGNPFLKKKIVTYSRKMVSKKAQALMLYKRQNDFGIVFAIDLVQK